jgi:hypothetical protein
LQFEATSSKKVIETPPSQPTSWEFWCATVIPSVWRGICRRNTVQGWPQARTLRTYFKNSKDQKKGGTSGVAQVVEYLLNKHEALSSNASMDKKNFF